jgi:hypothetical protein
MPMAPPDADDALNAEAHDRVQRRLRRCSSLSVIFVAMLAAGLFGPCVLLCVLPESLKNFTVLALSGLGVGVVGLGGLLLMIADLFTGRRTLGLIKVADRLGLTFTEFPKAKDYAHLTPLELFDRGSNPGGRNLAVGPIEGAEATFLDLTIILPGASMTQTVSGVAMPQTVAALLLDDQVLPQFLLAPTSWLDRIANMLCGRHIKVPGEREFNRCFALYGEEVDAVLDLFTDEVIDLCLREPRLTLEANGPLLAGYEFKKTQPAEGCLALIKHLRTAAGALRRSRR